MVNRDKYREPLSGPAWCLLGIWVCIALAIIRIVLNYLAGA